MFSCAGGNTFPIVGIGTLHILLRSGEGVVCVRLLVDVAHVPGLSHHLLSLRRIADARDKYIGTLEGIRTVFAKPGDELLAPSYGKLNSHFGYCTDTYSKEKAYTVIAQGVTPTSSTATDITDLHFSHGHMHEDLLRKAVKQNGVNLQGQLAPCQGCSEAKGTKKSFKSVTHTRAIKSAERCFVDLAGPKSVQSPGGKEYMMIVRVFFSRFAVVFFPLYQRQDNHVFSNALGRDCSPQGRGGEE